MKQFTLFKSSKDNYQFIVDVFKMLVGNAVNVHYIDDLLVIYHNEFNKEEIKLAFKSLESDLNCNICVYQSYAGIKLKEELELILPIFSNLEYGSFDMKTLLLETKVDKALDILHFIIDGTGVDEKVIEVMALTDLNVSKAASLLYLHRNSLNYKLDRLLNDKGFDLRRFIDCFCLYKLM